MTTILHGLLLATLGFSFQPEGVETPRGLIKWADTVAISIYSVPEQRTNAPVGMQPKVRYRSEKLVELDCFEPKSRTYLPLRLELDGDYLRVKFLAGDIVEPWGCNFRAMSVDILPTLLTAAEGERGHYLLPIFTGAYAPFPTAERKSTSDRIYMEQREWEKFGIINAFGMVSERGGWLGIVNQGDFRARIETETSPQGGSQFARIQLRSEVADALEFEDKEVLFKFLPEAKDYSALALAFGKYLRMEKGLKPLAERECHDPRLKAITEAVRVNIFIGMKRWPFRPDGTSPYFASTSFAEAERIVEQIHAAGIERAWVTLVGWIPDGHDGRYPSHFPVNERAGGEAALRKLIAKIRAYGWAVTPHDNIHSIYSCSTDRDMSVSSKTRAGEYQSMGIWSGGLTYIACPQVWSHRYGGDFERIRDLGFDGVYYIDALQTGLFRCYDPVHPADEKAFALGQQKILGYMRAQCGASATELPSIYTLKYIDYGANGSTGERAPMVKRPVGNAHGMVERIVPFWNIAVHGLIVIQPTWINNYRRFAGGQLGLFVDGGVPAMEVVEHEEKGVIGDYWGKSLADIKEPYSIVFEKCRGLQLGNTVGFTEFAPDAVEWVFDNGYVVRVNATAKPAGALSPHSLQILKDGCEIVRR